MAEYVEVLCGIAEPPCRNVAVAQVEWTAPCDCADKQDPIPLCLECRDYVDSLDKNPDLTTTHSCVVCGGPVAFIIKRLKVNR